MLRKSLAIFSGVAVLSSLAAVFNAPSYAAPDGPFDCDESSLSTYVVRSRKVILSWRSQEFSDAGYNPLERCQQVSGRFNTLYDANQLKFITAGIVNRLPVVCATTSGGSCNRNNVLFTLSKKNSRNLAGVLQRLFNNRDGVAGPSVVYESSERAYIDVNKLLSDADVNNSAPEQSSPSSEPSAAPSGGGW